MPVHAVHVNQSIGGVVDPGGHPLYGDPARASQQDLAPIATTTSTTIGLATAIKATRTRRISGQRQSESAWLGSQAVKPPPTTGNCLENWNLIKNRLSPQPVSQSVSQRQRKYGGNKLWPQDSAVVVCDQMVAIGGQHPPQGVAAH